MRIHKAVIDNTDGTVGTRFVIEDNEAAHYDTSAVSRIEDVPVDLIEELNSVLTSIATFQLDGQKPLEKRLQYSAELEEKARAAQQAKIDLYLDLLIRNETIPDDLQKEIESILEIDGLGLLR